MAKIEVAVLGGGMASIATAFSLTATPELRQQYDVTLYQLGWRIGGKGASGRDPQCADRIEEHGLHVWFGFYDNAFGMMRECYEELSMAKLEDMFKPCDDFVLYEKYQERWIGHPFHAPRNGKQPGVADGMPPFWTMAENALGWVLSLWPDLPPHLEAVRGDGGPLLELAHRLAQFRASLQSPLPSLGDHHPILVQLLGEFRDWLWRALVEPNLDNDELRFFFTSVDFVAAVIRGVAEDNLIDGSLGAVNDEDFREWLQRHGAKPITLENSVLVRMPYSAAFAFLDGDIGQPNLAAGVALSTILQILFGYKGSVFYKMQAGMGDVVFAPFYKVLKQRGVDFKFFHAVEKLHIAGGLIDSIDVVEQVKIVEQAGPSVPYDPLIEVNDLSCWPNQPRWEQIVGGELLRKNGIDLESEHNPPGAEPRTLHRGTDFDIVVLGISVAALKEICGELYHDDENFRLMIDHSRTAMTQAFQVWSTQDLTTGLGWPFSEDFILSTYVEPLDTYAVMNQLIKAESWPPAANLRSIHYFCGALKDVPAENQAGANGRVRQNAIDYLKNDAVRIWPRTLKNGAFNWDTLVDLDNRAGAARFDAQFWRANFAPTERYVLSPAGSIKFRLKTDQTKYSNLRLTGDWIECGGNAGCIECAVTAGMLAAQAIKGTNDNIAHADDKLISSKSATAPSSGAGEDADDSGK